MKKFKIEIKWALIFAVIALLWMVMEKALGWHDEKIDQHATLTMLFVIPAIIIYYLALTDKRRNFYDGKMTWLQGFLSGLYIGIIVAVLSPVTQYVVSYYISPDYFKNAIEYSVSSGALEQDVAERHFNYSSYVLQSSLGAVVSGAVTAALVALITKRS